MSYDLNREEQDLLKSLTPYPKWFGSEHDNSLNHFASLKLAAKHHNGWTIGAETHLAINWLKSLQPSRIKTCKNCGG